MISIAIPTHDMANKEFFLRRSLNAIKQQTYKDIEVVITDNSDDRKLEEVAKEFDLNIKYFKNEGQAKTMAVNTNTAMLKSTGELIKVLYLDDYLAHDRALEDIVHNFQGEWLVSACNHSDGTMPPFNNHYPGWSENLKSGENLIGSPSVMTVKRDSKLLFDENMTWLLDCDYYVRMNEKYGSPTYLMSINVTIGVGEHQMTNILSDEIKNEELEYIKNK